MNNQGRPITREQMIALQSLYSKWRTHELPGDADRRAARVAWASQNVGHPIASFLDLSSEEALSLIDALKGTLGQPTAQQPHPWRKIRSRDRAQSAGTAGRKDADASFVQMASADDLARIDEALRRLGWSKDRYAAWLRSSVSPLPSNVSGTIRTVAEANKVWWALKGMLRRSARWYPKAEFHNAPDKRCIT